MPCVQRRARTLSDTEDLPRPWRRVCSLPSRHVREEPKRKLAKPPTESLKRFYFDTIVHSKQALDFLVGTAGAERVLHGSDYPFDMGMPEGVAQVRSLSVSAADQSAILGGRARALLDTASARAFA
jgi:aminocarboxymuconate-semialdehyde decarboxylase